MHKSSPHVCMLSCSFVSLCDPMDFSLPGSSVHGILQAGILGCHALLQGIFPTQGSNPCLLCLLHWQVGSLPLVPPGKPPIELLQRAEKKKKKEYSKQKKGTKSRFRGFPQWLNGEEFACQCLRHRFNPCVWQDSIFCGTA